MKNQKKPYQWLRNIIHRVLGVVGALVLTLCFFLVLPLIQTLGQPPSPDLVLQSVDTANIPPPPPPPEEEPEEDEPEEEPPELTEEAPPLDLSQLELALNPGVQDGWLAGDFAVKLTTLSSDGEDLDALFSLSDLDQKPRVVFQPGPAITPEMRKRTPAVVHIVFIVNKDGRVENPIVQKSTDSSFDRSALAAVKQWKFDPGRRKGEPVRFRMRVPLSFPKD